MCKVSSVALSVLAAMAGVLILESAAEAVVIANWRFEPGSFLLDSSGNGHTLTGNAASSTDVADANGGGGSALFDGTTQSLQTINPLDLSSYDHVRVSFAVRNAGSVSSFGVVLEHSANQNTNPGGFLFNVDELGGSVGTATLKMSAGATATHNIDQLPHNSDGINWDLFVIDLMPKATDAAEVVQVTRNGTLLADSVGYGLHGTLATQSLISDILYLGARGGSGSFFNGNLDEVLIEVPPFIVAPEAAIPEPSSLALLVCAGLFWRRKRKS